MSNSYISNLKAHCEMAQQNCKESNISIPEIPAFLQVTKLLKFIEAFEVMRDGLEKISVHKVGNNVAVNVVAVEALAKSDSILASIEGV